MALFRSNNTESWEMGQEVGRKVSYGPLHFIRDCGTSEFESKYVLRDFCILFESDSPVGTYSPRMYIYVANTAATPFGPRNLKNIDADAYCRPLIDMHTSKHQQHRYPWPNFRIAYLSLTFIHPLHPKRSPVAYHIPLRHQSSALKPRYARPTYHYSHHPDVSLRSKFQCFSCHPPPLSLSAPSQSYVCSTLPSPVLGAEN